MRPIFQRLRQFLLQPVDSTSLAVFRMVFGCAVAADMVRYVVRGNVDQIWVRPQYHFTYFPFDGLELLPGPLMHALFWLLAALGVLIAVGLLTRLACVSFAVLFTYVFLLEQAVYLNHFYLICLLAWLLALLPANAAWSLDAWLIPRTGSATIPNWALWTIRGQLFICYFYGGLAKLNYDWLMGEPMRIWLAEKQEFPVLGPLFLEAWMPYFFAYGGLLFDLLIVPAILWRKTRWPALAAAAFFHLANARLFPIGIFPWLMLGATTIFLPPDWPRQLVSWLGLSWRSPRIPNLRGAVASQAPPQPPLSWRTSSILALLAIHFSVQLIVPFRHYLYPDDASWTEEGHLFAWRMKLRDKRGWVRFVITDPATGRTIVREPEKYLPQFQYNSLLMSPDLIWQHAQQLASQARAAGLLRLQVRCESSISLNGRFPQPLIDPAVDLAAQPRPWGHASWVVRLHEPLPGPQRTIFNAMTAKASR
jgi:vitamin K-dependent gamma-carboxylase